MGFVSIHMDVNMAFIPIWLSVSISESRQFRHNYTVKQLLIIIESSLILGSSLISIKVIPLCQVSGKTAGLFCVFLCTQVQICQFHFGGDIVIIVLNGI